MAAGALARGADKGDPGEARDVLRRELRGENAITVVLAARTLENLGEAARPLRGDMEAVLKTAAGNQKKHPGWMYVRFSLEAAVERFSGE